MKIRTDFVTNSSSNCFVIELTLEPKDGSEQSNVRYKYERGDEESVSMDVNGCSVGTYSVGRPLSWDDPEEFYENIGDFMRDEILPCFVAVNVESFFAGKDIVEVIDEAFALEDSYEEEDLEETVGEDDWKDGEDEIWDDETYGPEWDEVRKEAMDALEPVMLEYSRVMEKEPVVKTVRYEFRGYGDGLPTFPEMLDEVYGYRYGQMVAEAAGSAETLKRLLPNHSEQAIERLISLAEECEFPGEVYMTFSLNEDGKIDLNAVYVSEF